MQTMRIFIDTHHRAQDTFPESLTPEQFKLFYDGYIQACREEHVIPLQTHVGYESGRSFCINMAESAEAVRRVHERVGLPFDSITEIATAHPNCAFFPSQFKF